ncbi:MAG: histidinol-phosphate transaminase [Bacteroidota bacterium]
MGFNLNNIIRENLKGLKPYSSARDEYVSDGSKMVFLDANENPFNTGLNRYPDPQQRGLKAVLSEKKGISISQILLGNGSDEVLDLIFRAFCEPGKDNIITLPPTYGMYQVLAGVNAVTNREVYLTSRFEPDVDRILKAVDPNTKLIFLCSPNNPTGNRFDPDLIGEILRHFQGLVVIDEAYIDFAGTAGWLERLADYPNLIVTQTLSKAYGMAGIRLGICYAAAEIIAILNTIKPPYNVNELTQQRALLRVLDQRAVAEEVSRILSERKKMIADLKTIPFVLKVYPTDANFILAQVDDANLRYNQLLKQGIVVRNRSKQPLCENTLRFTVGTSNENEQLISALQSI